MGLDTRQNPDAWRCWHYAVDAAQSRAAALELAILYPGRPLFEVRAPGRRQQAML
jgi:hypothetical protein